MSSCYCLLYVYIVNQESINYFVVVPSPPTNLSVPALVSTSDGGYVVILEWSPPLDDGGAVVTSYHVFVNRVNMENVTITTMAIIGLNSAGEYLVQVRAVNCAGYSDNVSLSINTDFTGNYHSKLYARDC